MLQRTRFLATCACAALLAGMAATAHARGPMGAHAGGYAGSHGPAYAVRGGGYHGHGGGGYRYGGYGYGYRGWGPSWGLFVGAPLLYPWVVGPTVEVLPQTIIVPDAGALPVATLPATPSRADPVIYPRNGQSAQQTEADRQDCNRWATTQPAAMADASVFHRAVEACMDGRGYTLR